MAQELARIRIFPHTDNVNLGVGHAPLCTACPSLSYRLTSCAYKGTAQLAVA